MEVSYLVTLCSLLACMDLDYIHKYTQKYTQKYHTQTGSCTRRRCFSSHPACAGSFPSASVSPPSSCTWPWQPGLPYTPHCSALTGGLNMPRTTQTVRRVPRPLMLHACMSLPLGGAPFSFMRSAYS